MGKSQPTSTKEFKQQAVLLFESSGKNKTQIARDLGISDSALRDMDGGKRITTRAINKRVGDIGKVMGIDHLSPVLRKP
jgi:hypothetical protein